MTKHDLRAAALATIMAERSDVRQKHGAVIYKHGYIISKGFNQNKTHPRANRYKYPFIHAELDVILKSKNEDLSGTCLAVVRINRRGQLLNSLPCEKCMDLIKEVGIKYLIYSTTKALRKIEVFDGDDS